MDKKKILQWIDNILTEDGKNLSFGSIRTLGDIRREIETHICRLPSHIIGALNSSDGSYHP
jgi:hypothetical protein